MIKYQTVINMYLFNFEFSFNLSTIIAFLIGIVSGIILLVLIYTLYVLITLNKKEVNITCSDLNNDRIEVEEQIKKAQIKFLKIRKENKDISLEIFKYLLVDLMNDVAKIYYPNSEHPLSELTIKELILLSQYLSEKVESILDHFGLRFMKKIKMSSVIDILNMKRTIDHNNLIQATKKISNFSSKLWSLINFLNPVMWIKRGIINPSINLITKKICLLVISTVGIETYHIYSKQAFLDPILDKDIEKLIKTIEEEQDNTSNHDLIKKVETVKKKVKI